MAISLALHEITTEFVAQGRLHPEHINSVVARLAGCSRRRDALAQAGVPANANRTPPWPARRCPRKPLLVHALLRISSLEEFVLL
jgi:hypothetical protein